MAHLTDEQLLAYRDGELKDPEALHHLKECGACRARLADSRVFRALLRPLSERRVKRHPDGRTLALYLEDALSPRMTSKVERHLDDCERCRAAILSLRKATGASGQALSVAQADHAVPSREVVERVREQFATPQPRQSLAEVSVEGLEWGEIRWHVPPAGTVPADNKEQPSAWHSFLAACERSTLRPRPGSARARALRFHKEMEAEYLQAMPKAKAAPPFAAVSPALCYSPPSSELSTGKVLEFKTDEFFMRLSINHRRGKRFLAVTAFALSSLEPIRGLDVTLVPPQASPITRRTGRNGKALFPLSRGESRLMVHTSRIWELALNVRPEKK